MSARCFHCDEPIDADRPVSARVGGRERTMCCAGCAAVAQLIDSRGLGRFYEYRTSPAVRPDSAHESFAACDRQQVRQSILEPTGDGGSSMRCRIDGLTCAACTWLVNKAMRSVDGVREFTVNPLTSQATVTFEDSTPPSAVLGAIAQYGFSVRPVARSAERGARASDSGELRRLAVAGLGFAQVMSLSAALYLGAFKSMSPLFESFLTLVSLLVATPVVLYAGMPFFRNALRDALRRHVGMDVPVALAIAAALAASIFNALRGSGPVYFDSATMFVFFLTLGRFLEARARYRAGQTYQCVDELIPVSATRVTEDGHSETVGTMELVPGDVVLVAPGKALPADGALVSRQGQLDESLLSGESRARLRSHGETVLGGSINIGARPLELRVTAVGRSSYIGRVSQLLEAAMAHKPASFRSAERWASRFAAALLLASALVGCLWLAIAPAQAFSVVLAMLVVTCPCAISLAAPAAFAAGLGALAGHGLLLRSTEVIDRLLDVRTWLFDKTGTVTDGHMAVAHTQLLGHADEQQCLRIAAALEAGIDHPLARAFVSGRSRQRAADVEYFPGRGVTGTVDGHRWQLGSAAFVGVGAGTDADNGGVWLARAGQVYARFEIAERLRPQAAAAMHMLNEAGMSCALVSGDAEPVVAATAARLHVDAYHAERLPEQKLAVLRAAQERGQRVAVVGDGINDAPFLAQADVSIAMMAGSELARATADVVCTNDDLRVIAMLPAWAAQIRRTIAQNIGWAVAYNLTAIPLAAAGFVPPWLAALGMSASSVLVVLNGLRLGSNLRLRDEPRHRGHTTGAMLAEAS